MPLLRLTSTYQALVSTVAASAGAGFTAASMPIARVAATTAATRTTSDVFLEGRDKPHRRPSSIHPFVHGSCHQVRVQRWLLPFEQE
ncbi:hypothetical protein SGLAM104S_05437 [Streptomyces glaucescens]